MSGWYINVHGGEVYRYGENNDVRIESVSYQLSRLPRFVGATRFPYWIGQHCVNVVHLLNHMGCGVHTQKAGLLHDAHEYIMGDMPTPFERWFCDRFANGENVIEQAKQAVDADILPTLGVPYPFDERTARDVKHADITAFLAESHVVFGNRPSWLDAYMSAPEVNINHVEYLIPFITPMDSETVDEMFMKRYERLTHDCDLAEAS